MPEIFFKLAFVGAFAVAAMVGTTTARRAARKHGTGLNQLPNEARGLVALRALIGIVFYAALAAWLFWPARMRWAYLPIPLTVRTIAVCLLVPTLAFFAWSFRTIGDSYRGGVGLYEQHRLVTTGPYARMRHPIYAAFITIMVLVLLMSADWVLGVSGLVLVGIIARVRIPIEEAELQARFGDSWNDYTKRTGSLLPR